MIIEKNKDNDFEIETSLSYKNPDGSRGWIVRIKPKKKDSQS